MFIKCIKNCKLNKKCLKYFSFWFNYFQIFGHLTGGKRVCLPAWFEDIISSTLRAFPGWWRKSSFFAQFSWGPKINFVLLVTTPKNGSQTRGKTAGQATTHNWTHIAKSRLSFLSEFFLGEGFREHIHQILFWAQSHPPRNFRVSEPQWVAGIKYCRQVKTIKRLLKNSHVLPRVRGLMAGLCLRREVTALRHGTKEQNKTWWLLLVRRVGPAPCQALTLGFSSRAVAVLSTLHHLTGSGHRYSTLSTGRNLESETLGVSGNLKNHPSQGPLRSLNLFGPILPGSWSVIV